MSYRRILFLLALCVLVGFTTSVLAASFPDVSGTVYETAFSSLSADGIVQGYPDGSGRPWSPLNRVEALKIVLNLDSQSQSRVAFYQRSLPPMSLFTDIDQSAWYAPYVEAGFERGLITGYPDGSFRPGQLLRVEEAVALLLRSIGEGGGGAEAAELSSYIENRDGQWFTASINSAIRRNLVMHQGTLRLSTAITRGQFFDMAYRLKTVRTSGATAYTGEEPRQTTVPVVQRNGQQGGGGTLAAIPYASEKYFAVSMPTLGITDLSITHPQDAFSNDGILAPLQYGVGHLFSYPGNGGKIMVYGHSSGYPWDVSQYTKVFRQINKLQVGDRVYVTYSSKLYVYEVAFTQAVNASDTSPFNDDGSGEELILYTCWPPDSISQRYLVHALPVETIALQ